MATRKPKASRGAASPPPVPPPEQAPLLLPPGPAALRFKGRPLALPSVAGLLHSASRSAIRSAGSPLQDALFLPDGYLQVTEAHDLGATARGLSDAFETTLAGDASEVLVIELADGGTLITSTQGLTDALARNRPDLIGADGAVLFDRLSSGDGAARGVLADLVGGIVSKVFKLLVGVAQTSDPIVDLAVGKLAEWVGAKVGAKAEDAAIAQAALGLSWLGAKALMWAVEEKLQRPAGKLYRWQGEGELTAAGAASGPPADETRAMLVFIHGTGSSTLGSFGALQRHDRGLWAVLEAAFPGGIYGFEHRTLSEGPIDNALQLLAALPPQAQLSIVSHSRGGLVADLLCLADLDRCIADYHYEFPAAAVAPKLADAHAEQQQQLTALAALLRERAPQVQRYLRVASPAQGTKLASGNIDVFLSGLLTLIGVVPYFFGNPLYAAFKRVVIEVAKRRTDPHLVPGIECMLPDSPLAALLARAEPRPGVQLGLIAGDIEASNLLVRLGVLLTDFLLFDQVDNDLVVDTGSMLGGIAAKAGARVLFDRGAAVSHFNYFSNQDTRSALRDWLTSAQPADDPAFQALPGHFESLDALGISARSAGDADRPVVVLLPGIMGSHLAVPRDGRIWLAPLRIAIGGLDQLAWDKNPVEAEAVFDMAYGALCRQLAASHRVVTFPYDWRLPLDVLGDRLGELLARLQKDSPQPIRLLAHSMGGLVVRACIHRRRPVIDALMARDGARLVMLGVPHQGSHSMVENLLGKGSNLRTLVRLDLKHDMQQVLDLVADFPGTLQLLPRPGFADTFQGSQGGGEAAGVRAYFKPDTWATLKLLNTDLWFGNQRGATPSAGMLERGNWLWQQDQKASGDGAPALPAGYAAKSVYVCGVAPNTACGLRVEGGRLRMVGTHRGDGTVTWDSGRIGGIGSVYYLPALHGDLLNSRAYFGAITDLLVSGATAGLPTTPPAQRAADAAGPRVYDPGPPELADSGNAELALLGGSPSRQVQARARRGLAVTVRGMDLRFVTAPILVGHYQSDPIAGPQHLIDTELLDGKLSQRHCLGLYAGPLGSATVVLQAPNPAEQARGSLVGAVVTGLGDYSGALSQDNLLQAVRAGVLRFLLQAVDVLGSAERELPLASLLLGYNSSANLSVAASLEALVRGVIEANARFADTTGLKLRVASLDIIELYQDTAITAAYALRQLTPLLAPLAAKLDTQLVCATELVQGNGLRQRLFDGGNSNYWPRLMVTDADSGGDDDNSSSSPPPARPSSPPCTAAAGRSGVRLADRLRFLYVGQRARAESMLQQRQPGLIEALVGQQIGNAVWNEDFGRLLFQLLVPPDFKDALRQLDRIVLVVDAATANLPWELMLPEALGSSAAGAAPERLPLAVRSSVVRQLASGRFRRQVRQLPSRNALVVGNPSVAGFASHFPDPSNPKGLEPAALPGAETEATEIAKLLASLGYAVSRAIGSDTTAAMVLAKLYRQPYRLLHISAHGVFEQCHIDGLPRSGVLLSGGLLIGAAEIAAMELVPELVFLNCCHLGQVEATVRQGNKLAASVARELIDIGVRCVVVAGWAVTDSLAQQFGEVFYQALMQQRKTFGEALSAARRALWDKQPGDITWGAFQAYGDPGWRAEPAADGAGFGGDGDEPFVSMDELLDQLARARAELARRPERQTATETQALVKRIDTLLENRCPPAWLARPALQSALGATWRDLGQPQRAYPALLAAIQADDQSGRVPIRDVEQLANIEARLGEKIARAALGKPPVDPDEVQRGEDYIHRAIERLNMLDKIVAGPALAKGSAGPLPSPNAERAALLGSAWKRLASVQAQRLLGLPPGTPGSDRPTLLTALRETLAKASLAYRSGEGQPGGTLFMPYNVLNRLALDSLLGSPDDAAAQAEAKALADQCRRALAAAFGTEGDVWLAVMQPETVLIEQLQSGGLAADPDSELGLAAWQRVSGAYAQAVATLLIRPWQLDSVVGQLSLLATFSQALHLGDGQRGWLRQAAQLDRLAQQLQPGRSPAVARRSMTGS